MEWRGYLEGGVYLILFSVAQYSDKFCHHLDTEQNIESFIVWLKTDWWQTLVNQTAAVPNTHSL